MSKQISPFAALTGAEKQIRWLEYQSIRLPYVDIQFSEQEQPDIPTTSKHTVEKESVSSSQPARPQPPPEVPRTYHPDTHKPKHSQYDAVIARLKQAELQSRIQASQAAQQMK